MTTAALLKEINLLPVNDRLVLAEKIIHSVHQESVSVKPKRKKFPPNPNNPSPSGDPFWDNPANLAMLTERICDIEEGRATFVDEDDPEIQAFFASARQ
jgi:hypothetical protein